MVVRERAAVKERAATGARFVMRIDSENKERQAFGVPPLSLRIDHGWITRREAEN